jgi:ATP-dependent Clp protease ATP-binding subunit ClpA
LLSEAIAAAVLAEQTTITSADETSEHGIDESDPAPEEHREFEWPERTRRYLATVEPRDDLLERDEAVTQVLGVLGRHRRRVPIVLGRRGSGRTTFLGAVAGKLTSPENPERRTVLRVVPETLGPDPEGPLARIIADCEVPAILIIDDFDRVAGLGTIEPNGAVLMLLRAAARHPSLQLVLVCETRYFGRLAMYVEDMSEDLVPVRLDPLTDDAVSDVVKHAVKSIESLHGVKISPALRTMACLPARPADASVHPGLALDRLDAAASRAKVIGDSDADVAHLSGSASSPSHAMSARELEEKLSRRIQGQPNAVCAIASRLALTLSRLDLRPQRPDGVFLFVGPTGVGKTELARAISTSLFGGEDRLIRLDMSEYVHDWSVSRLVGPMPGYEGSTEPEHWLTTRVTQMPECVVLLDEIEKAHPVVWNTFLQVFDVGRLTDSRGSTADFSNAVIVMTSNLGATAASGPGLGFGNGDGDDVDYARERITRAVEQAMAPELINRIDELVVFDALSVEAIEHIAETELAQVCERLAESGWVVSYGRAVVKHLVSTGYDPAYGARHLQRNIERLFLGLIAQAESKKVSVRVSKGELVLSEKH